MSQDTRSYARSSPSQGMHRHEPDPTGEFELKHAIKHLEKMTCDELVVHLEQFRINHTALKIIEDVEIDGITWLTAFEEDGRTKRTEAFFDEVAISPVEYMKYKAAIRKYRSKSSRKVEYQQRWRLFCDWCRRCCYR